MANRPNIVINLKEWKYDNQLLSSIMTDRIDEFSIEDENGIDLYTKWEQVYKDISDASKYFNKEIKIDIDLLLRYVDTLNYIMKKAYSNVKDLEGDNDITAHVLGFKDIGPVKVFKTIQDIIDKYNVYMRLQLDTLNNSN